MTPGNDAIEPAYVGIDVACAKQKFLPISVGVVRGGKLEPLPLRALRARPPRGGGNVLALDSDWCDEFALQTELYLYQLEDHFSVRIERIALDAPATPCPPHLSKRASEEALDTLGVSYFKTPSEEKFSEIKAKAARHLHGGGAVSQLPHANQLWMLVGFALFKRLSPLWTCLEVYPQATVHLLGCSSRHKSHSSGLAAQMRAVGKQLGWDHSAFEQALKASSFGKRHDQLDAYLAAWVASLAEGQREALGVPPDDAIWVPKIDRTGVAELVATGNAA